MAGERGLARLGLTLLVLAPLLLLLVGGAIARRCTVTGQGRFVDQRPSATSLDDMVGMQARDGGRVAGP